MLGGDRCAAGLGGGNFPQVILDFLLAVNGEPQPRYRAWRSRPLHLRFAAARRRFVRERRGGPVC